MFDAAPSTPKTTSPNSLCGACPRTTKCLGHLIEAEICHTAPHFARGEHLFQAGDAVEFLYVIRKGAVKSYRVTADGQEQIVGFHGAGDVVGVDSLAVPEFQGNAVAIQDTEVCRLPASSIRRRMAESDSFRLAVLGDLGREIQRLHRLLHLERCTAEQRVAAFLLNQLRKHGAEGAKPRVELPMSRAEIGSFLDLATETVSRMFTRLHERGVLRVVPGAAEIVDAGALGKSAQGGAAEARPVRFISRPAGYEARVAA